MADYLADDYQLGNKVHRAGFRIELSDASRLVGFKRTYAPLACGYLA